jgi:hypothetical protein
LFRCLQKEGASVYKKWRRTGQLQDRQEGLFAEMSTKMQRQEYVYAMHVYVQTLLAMLIGGAALDYSFCFKPQAALLVWMSTFCGIFPKVQRVNHYLSGVRTTRSMIGKEIYILNRQSRRKFGNFRGKFHI